MLRMMKDSIAMEVVHIIKTTNNGRITGTERAQITIGNNRLGHYEKLAKNWLYGERTTPLKFQMSDLDEESLTFEDVELQFDGQTKKVLAAPGKSGTLRGGYFVKGTPLDFIDEGEAILRSPKFTPTRLKVFTLDRNGWRSNSSEAFGIRDSTKWKGPNPSSGIPFFRMTFVANFGPGFHSENHPLPEKT